MEVDKARAVEPLVEAVGGTAAVGRLAEVEEAPVETVVMAGTEMYWWMVFV